MPSESDGSPRLAITGPFAQDDHTFEDIETMSHTSSHDPGSARPSLDSAMGLQATPENQRSVNNIGQSLETAEAEKPAWTEMKTKAGKERKRLPLACLACRRKKIRCSGEKPVCKHCFRSRIPCVYKVTTRKAAPRTDYMAMLDKRLKRMEHRVIKMIPKDETRDMVGIGRSVVKPTLQDQPSKAIKKRTADDAFASDSEHWAKVDRTNAPTAFSMSREVKSGDGASGLLTEGAEFLPTMEIQEHLAEVFFDCVYGQSYLLLHKPSFMRRLKACTIPPVLILAVCGVSARFSTHPQINSEPPFLRGENWANPAAAIALSRHDEPNITILTVFLLLGLHEFGTCHGGRSWSFGGQALRMAYALQLHNEVDHDPLLGQNSQLSFTDREIRRRTMWACFLMDRYNSSGSQRPPIGNEKFLHIQLPVKESHFQMEIPGPTEDLDGNVPNPVPEGMGQMSDAKQNMGVSAYIIKGIVLWGRIVDYLNLGGKKKDPHPLWSPQSGYSQLKRRTEEFAAALPISLLFTQENLQIHAAEKTANQFIFLHMIIHQNVLFLNQFAIPLSPGGRPPRDMPKSFLSDAGRAAVEAAHHISSLIDCSSGYPLTVPFAGYCAYTASTVHIWGIFSKNAQLEARSKENLRHTYRYLNKMKMYWGMFHYMVESAKDRYRQFADAAIRGTVCTHNGSNAAMFQYGDWFDKYPHGVSRLHWEDPDPAKHKESGDDAVMGQKPDLQSVEDFFAGLSPSTPQHIFPRRAHARKNSKSSDGVVAGASDQATTSSQPLLDVSRGGPTSHPIGDSPMTAPTPTIGFPQPLIYTSHDRSPPFGQSPFDFGIPSDHLPQIDRQFVFGSFAGFDPVSLGPMNPGLSPLKAEDVENESTSPIWPGQLDPNVPSGTGEFYQPSAWFLPFNLDPLGGGLNLDFTGHSQSSVAPDTGMNSYSGAQMLGSFQMDNQAENRGIYE